MSTLTPTSFRAQYDRSVPWVARLGRGGKIAVDLLDGIPMARMFGWIGAALGGTVGWWLGAKVGIMTAFMFSMVGTGAGIYLGRRIAVDRFVP